MGISEYLAGAISSGAGAATVAIIVAFRRGRWHRDAHKLAARSDIALPAELVGRVAGYLRGVHLVAAFAGILVTALITAPLSLLDGQHDWSQWLPRILTVLPGLCAVVSYVVTAWPTWTPSGPTMLATGPRAIAVQQLFTLEEITATAIGAAFAIIAGVWGLWIAAAPGLWWIAFASSCVLAIAIWQPRVVSILSRPDAPSDVIERGWDDVIRFQKARVLTIGAAWGPASLIFLADYAYVSQHSHGLVFWPLYVVIAAAALLARTYRQGRRRWREASRGESIIAG